MRRTLQSLVASLFVAGCAGATGPAPSSTAGACGQLSASCRFDGDCCGGFACVVAHCAPFWSDPGNHGSSSGGSTSASSGPFGGTSGGSTGSDSATTSGGGTSGSSGSLVPCLTVAPTALELGSVQVSGMVASSTLSITNGCGAQQVIQFGAITGANADQFSETQVENTTLGAGQTLQVTLSFAPTAPGAASATLPFTSNGDTWTIELDGTGVDGQLVFSPSPIDFGNVPFGTTAQQLVSATNMGNEALTVQANVEREGAAFGASNLPALPLQLEPLQEVTFTVDYSPSGAAGADTGSFTVHWTVADPAVGSRAASDTLTGN